MFQNRCLLSSEALCVLCNICSRIWEVHLPPTYESLWQAVVKLEAVCPARVLFEANPQHRAYDIWWKSWSLFRDGAWGWILDSLRTPSFLCHFHNFIWINFSGRDIRDFLTFFFIVSIHKQGYIVKTRIIYSLLYMFLDAYAKNTCICTHTNYLYLYIAKTLSYLLQSFCCMDKSYCPPTNFFFKPFCPQIPSVAKFLWKIDNTISFLVLS